MYLYMKWKHPRILNILKMESIPNDYNLDGQCFKFEGKIR